MSDALGATGVGVLPTWSRTPWFLTTAPERQPSTIDRPRVVAAVAAAVDRHPIVAVTAHSGYGKSTAVADWARSCAAPVAWLTLTEYDRDPARITNGVMIALRRLATVDPSLAALDGLDLDPLDAASTLDALAAVTRDAAQPVTLVIDQADHPEGVRDSALGALLIRPLPRLRIVVVGTAAVEALGGPGVMLPPTARISADDLAFDDDEIVSSALRLGASPTPAEATAIATRTHGWPIAVRIQLLALGGGVARDLADHVESAILANLPPRLDSFIRAATTTQILSARLATAISGAFDAAAMLEECVRRGLFLGRVTRADGERIYTWHAAFRDAAQSAERHRDPVTVHERHRAAAAALEHEFPVVAITHYLDAAAPDEAYRLITRRWLEMFAEGGAASLGALLGQLPPEFAERAAILGIRASIAWITGDPPRARALLAEARAAEVSPSDALVTSLASMTVTDDPDELLQQVQRAHRLLAESGVAADPRTSAYALFVVGYAELRLRRDRGASITTLTAARRDAEAGGALRLAARISATLGFACAFEGRFGEALAHGERSRETAIDGDWLAYDGGAARSTEGFVAYWRDDLPGARAAFADVVRSEFGAGGFEPLALMYDALAAAASHDLGWQTSALERLRSMPSTTILGTPWHGFRACALAALALERGAVDDAVRFAAAAGGDVDLPVPRAMAAETLRRAGHPAEARRLIAETDATQLTPPARVRIMLTEALLRDEAGARDSAHVVLERSLDLAAPESILRPYCDDLPELVHLLESHARWGTSHGAFLARVFARRGVADAAGGRITLSPREAETLAYLRTSMTVGEIAAALSVSPNTVKTHLRSLYRKLGVDNRRDAVRVRL